MSEITKLYENAEVELIEGLEWVCQNPDHCVYQNLSVTPENCIGCEHFEREMRYPPFTTDKQIELIKLLLRRGLECNTCQTGKDIEYVFFVGYERSSGDYKEFTEALAGIMNDLWQDLYEKEKQQVKEILK